MTEYRRRDRLRVVGRLLFLGLAIAFAWLGLRGSQHELLAAMVGLGWWRPLGATVLCCVGLVPTLGVWALFIDRSGFAIPRHPAATIFFIGQLGKYIPGSVWSMGVQAKMAAVHGVPGRATLNASLSFLGVHVATGLLVAGFSGVTGTVLPWWSWLAIASFGAVGLLPSVIRAVAARVAGPGTVFCWAAWDSIRVLAEMTVAWFCYSSAAVLLVPSATAPQWVAVSHAITAGYVAGVAVPVAPAGLGAREWVTVVLLAPVVGVPAAAALALTFRVVQTVADFVMAALSWWLNRGAAEPVS